METDNCGIYSITSPSGNFYIGSSKNIKNRWWHHKTELKAKTHKNDILQKATNKYGLSNLVFERLLNCIEDDLLYYEQILLDNLKPIYNICTRAGRAVGNRSRFGKPHTEETKKKQSMARLGIKYSEETRQRMSRAKKGKPLSAEHIKKLIAVRRGRKNTPETIEKMRQAALLRWSKAA